MWDPAIFTNSSLLELSLFFDAIAVLDVGVTFASKNGRIKASFLVVIRAGRICHSDQTVNIP